MSQNKPRNRRFQTTDQHFARLESFEDEILIACENCEECATIYNIQTVNSGPERRRAEGSCPHCGKIWEFPYNTYQSWQALPLWLATDFRGHLLFAFNERHLLWLESFVGSELREDKLGHGSSGLHAIVPRWMSSAKNLDGVMEALGRLR
jgi:hypothetical protein